MKTEQTIRRNGLSRRMTSSNRKSFWMTIAVFLWCFQTSLLLVVQASSSAGTLSPPRSSSIPRSRRTSEDDTRAPLWNPSANIDAAGVLKGRYRRVPGEWEAECPLRKTPNTVLTESNAVCQIRQVPGDGNCLFHSISLCLHHAVNGTHYDLSNGASSAAESSRRMDGPFSSSSPPPLCRDDLYAQSRRLRAQAVACLRAERRLFLQGREWMAASELVDAAAQQYDLSPAEYCAAMEEEAVWGGGPEIVALCNLLQRPIHVYELATTNANAQFVLRRMACFGSPRFDHRAALHILSADSRFPDVRPGQQLAAGNHFLAVFPQSRRRGVLRGGDTTTEDEDDEEGIWDGRPPFWKSRPPSHWERWRQRMERCFSPLGLTFWDGSCC